MKHVHCLFVVIVVLTMIAPLVWGQPLAKIHVSDDGSVEILEVYGAQAENQSNQLPRSLNFSESNEFFNSDQDLNEITLNANSKSIKEMKAESQPFQEGGIMMPSHSTAAVSTDQNSLEESLLNNQSDQSTQVVTSSQAIQSEGEKQNSSNSMNPGPDLTAVSASCSRTLVYPNLTIAVRVINNGTTLAGQSVVGYFLSSDASITTSDTYLTNDYVPPLAVGAYSDESAIIDVSAYPGTWYAGFIIDYTSIVTEDNEANNAWYFPGSVVIPYPNLDFKSGTANVAFNSSTLDVTIDFSVENNGTGNAGSSTLGYYLVPTPGQVPTTSDIQIGTDYVTSLAPGGFSAETITTSLANYPGTWYVGYIIDYLDVIDESNEADNYWWTPTLITVPYPNLDPGGPASLTYTEPYVSATVRVHNTGLSTAAASTMGYYLSVTSTITPSDILIGTDYVTTLTGGSYSDESISSVDISAYPGTWYVGVYVDYLYAVTESSEGDNGGFYGTPVVVSNPNLTSQGLSCYRTYTHPNLTISVQITNDGASLAGASTLGYYLSSDATITTSDALLGSDPVSALSSGAISTEDITVDVSAYSGTFYVGFIIDYLDAVLENNEADNPQVFFPAIGINIAQPDFIVTDVSVLDPTGPQIGYEFSIENQGDAATTGGCRHGIYLSTDETIDGTDELIDDIESGALGVGETYNSGVVQTTVSDVPVGDYYLGVIADFVSCVPESDESNNTGYDAGTTVSAGPIVLYVPMVAAPPVIDGEMDPAWYAAQTVPIEKPSLDVDTAPDDWMDAFADFKMMWDEDNYYVFVRAHDDVLNTSNAESHLNDGVELFFDGDNSKNDAGTGYDANDVQIRYVFNTSTESTGNALNSSFAWMLTDNGYNCEIQIPASDMTFALGPDHTFGFDIAFLDNDSGSRDHNLKWWSASNNSWQDPSLFGTAQTTDYIAADPMYVLMTPDVPAIDGLGGDDAWDEIPWVSSNIFVDRSDGVLFDPPFDPTNLDGCNDCRFDYKLMWKGSMLYFYADVFDDVINTSHGDSYMNDGFQIFIDGNNDKTTSHDANDTEYAFVYTDTPPANVVFSTADFGWTIEAQMDLGAAPGMAPVIGQLMGLEVSNNDNDGGGRDVWTRWWSNDDISWANPSHLGTVQFSDVFIDTDVDDPEEIAMVTTFSLAQNYPNPFNPTTSIQYQVPEPCFVSLKVYGLLGQEIIALVNENRSPGVYTAEWNGENRASGIYFYRLEAGDFRETRKLVLQK
ncbi:T9SS type A sorting domain-containing protein [candidate division KSB1 bacterium]|nr:T9SS type A sorting domain-containing protein [candidate division KSB1 bacterium]